jgi:hypothetical protein
MDMQESVGKNCECIYAFEKHYIALALDDWITRQKEEVAKNKRLIEEEKAKGTPSTLAQMIENMIPQVEFVIHDAEIVKTRLEAMPTCK